MRTTIRLNDELFKRVKVLAAETHRTLTAVIEDSLRLILEKPPQPDRSRDVELPTSGSGGILPGIDLDDTSALLDKMEGFS